MGEDIVKALGDAATAAQTSITSGVTTVLPAAASVMALLIGIRTAFGFFKGLAG